MRNTKRFKIITWFIIAIMLLESIVSNGIIGRKVLAIDDTMVAIETESDDLSLQEVNDEEETTDNIETPQEILQTEQDQNDNQDQSEDEVIQEETIAQNTSNETSTKQERKVNSAPANNTAGGQFALNNSLNSAGLYVNGKISADTPWNLTNGTTYSAQLGFSESTGNGLPKDDTEMVYTLPSNITMVSGSTGTFEMAFESITVPGTYRVDGNNVIFVWDTASENFKYLQTASNAQFTFDLDFTYDGNGDSIKFSNDIDVPVELKDEYDIKGDKYAGDFCSSLNTCGSYGDKAICNLNGDDYNNIISYSVVVESDGLAKEGTVLKDTLSENGMTLCEESFYVIHTTKNSKGVSSTETIPLSSTDLSYQINTTDFSITFPQIKDGEKYEIKYFATVDLDILSQTATKDYNSLVKDGILNTMVITPPDGKEDITKSTTSKVYLSSIGKAGSNISYDKGDLDENMKGELSWKITSNSQHLISMAGEKITDTMGNNADKMTYSGEGITVTIKDKKDQVVDTITVDWATLGVNENSKSWSWTIPESYKDDESDDNFYSYEIAYTTTVDASGMTSNFQVTNNVSSSNGDASAQGNVGVPTFKLNKRVVNTTDSNVKWAIDISVPGRGVSPLEIQDILPNLNNTYVDKVESITVSGAEGYDIKYYKELWSLDSEVANKDDAICFRVFFWYTDGNGEKQYGVPASADGKSTDITIYVTTNINQDWYEHSAETGEDLIHTNSVNSKAGEESRGSSASTTIMKKSIEKNGKSVDCGYGNPYSNDFVKRQGYKYTIKLNGVIDDAITITDKFDTAWLKYASDDFKYYDGYWQNGKPAIIYGKNNDYDQYVGKEVSVEETADGIRITADEIPMNGTSYYRDYYIEYFLMIRDDKVEELNKEVARTSGGKLTFTNTAIWGNLSDSYTEDYTLKLIDKRIVNENTLTDDGSFTFSIDVNSDKLKIGAANTLELTDTHSSNLEVNYTSITYTTEPAGREVTYNVAGNSIIFQIPNETHVTITYTTSPINKTGSPETYTNEATLFGQSSKCEKTASFNVDADGSFSVIYVLIYKQQTGRTDIPLNGVTFKLYKYDESNSSWVDTGKSFTTGDYQTLPGTADKTGDGEALVFWFTRGNEEALLSNVQYKLVEQDPQLEGYIYDPDNSEYLFTIGNETNWGDHMYVAGQTIRVNNDAVEMVINKSFEGMDDLSETEIRELANGITYSIKDSSGAQIASIKLEDMVYSDSTGKFSYKLGAPQYNLDPDETYTVEETNNLIEDYKYISTKWTTTAGGNGNTTTATSSTGSTLNFVNKYKKSVVDIKVTKSWLDYNGEVVGWPSTVNSVVMQLQKKVNGEWEDIPGKTLTLNASTQKGTFSKLAKFDDNDDKIEYRVKEIEVEGYNSSITGSVSKGFTVTNAPKQSSLKITKTINVPEDSEVDTSTIRFVITDDNGNEVATVYYDDMDGSDTERTITLTSKDGIEPGTYNVKEYGAGDGVSSEYKITTTVTTDSGETAGDSGDVTVPAGDLATIEFTNTYKNGESIKVSKVDATDSSELDGATIQIIDEEGKVIAEWVSTNEAHTVSGLKSGVEYTLHEEVAPDGYTITSDTKFSIDDDGVVTSTGSKTTDADGNTVLLVEDNKTVVRTNKVDIADGAELDGAHIQIKDEEGKVVDEWDSEIGVVHETKGLITGKTYTLHETVAPDGYTIATDTEFVVDTDGTIKSTTANTSTDASGNTVLLVEDSKTVVRTNKVDIADGAELDGAHIQIKDENGKVVDEWNSEVGVVHETKGLITGKTYTLHETVAPDGYTIATDTEFVVDTDGTIKSTTASTSTDANGNTVLLVEDAKTVVKISKVDKANGTELDGAHIQIINENGDIVDEWDSEAGVVHETKGLVTRKTYILRETVSPDGYAVTTDTTFVIDENGKVTSNGDEVDNGLITIEDAALHFDLNKVDAGNGNEVEGAIIKLYQLDSEGNIVKDASGSEKVIDSWTSKAGKTHDFGEKLIAGHSYVLRETVAPTGYGRITTDMEFKVNKDGSIELNSSDITESQDSNGNKIYLIEDTAILFNVNKVDAGNGEEVEGATLVVYEIDKTTGEVVKEIDSWESKKGKTHNFGDKLESGKTYILRETIAPDGYAKIETDIKVVVAEDGSITTEIEGTTDANGDVVYLVKNAKKGSVVFNKKGRFNEDFASNSDETEAIAGVKFAISSVETPDEVIKTAISKEDGTIEFDDLNPGKYIITEIDAGHSNYKLDETKYYAEITVTGYTGLKYEDGTKVENDTIINEVYRGSIKFAKVNELHPDKKLKGSTYGLYRKVDSYAKTSDDTSNTKASINNDDGVTGILPDDAEIEEIDGEEYVKLAEATTDENGVVEFEGTLVGVDYIVKELVAPNGYYVSENPITLQLSVDNDGEITMSIVDDGSGTVALDENGNITWLEPVVIVNVQKVNEDGVILAGAKLHIEDKNGNVVAEWTSTNEEYVIEGKLVSGEIYKLVEDEAPNGYKVAATIEFTVDETAGANENTIVNLTMIDEKEEVTEDNKNNDDKKDEDKDGEIKEEKKVEKVTSSVKTGDTIMSTFVVYVVAAIVLLVVVIKRTSINR